MSLNLQAKVTIRGIYLFLKFFWIEHFIEINKRQKTHYTHTKYTNYILKRKKNISNTELIKFRRI